MRKVSPYRGLRLAGRVPASAAAAFSLSELVVSIGILVLMMSLVGQVFHLTVQSTGQATALTEVTQAIRNFEQTLRDDLRGVQPERSLILIQANKTNAYWSQLGRESDDNADAMDGYPHTSDAEREDEEGHLSPPRADLLLFYTAKAGTSYLDPGVSSNLQQVMYGHAELGDYPSTGSGEFSSLAGENEPMFRPASAGPILVPAAQWHLGRRSTLLMQGPPPPVGVSTPPGAQAGLLVNGQRDTLGNFDYQQMVLTPYLPSSTSLDNTNPWFLPSVLDSLRTGVGLPVFTRSRIDESPPPLLLTDAASGRKFYGMGHQLLPYCASFKVEWALNPHSPFVNGRLDGLGEMLWFDPGDDEDPLRVLQEKIDSLPVNDSRRERLVSLLGGRVSGRIASDMVCEVDALDYPPSQYNRQWPSWLCNPDEPEIELGMAYSLADRFRGAAHPSAHPNLAWPPPGGRSGDPMSTVIFTANRPKWKRDPISGNVAPDHADLIPDPMFPGALRVTIDVFDNSQRLERPVRHVMVIPIGE